MRRLALAFCLLAAPLRAEAPPDPYELATEAVRIYNDQSADAFFRHLDGAIREARGKGWLTPDWSILFAMLSDELRNTRTNPAYALRIADEGLALTRQSPSSDPADALMLEVSRAYALADLGRFEEAVAAAVLALPMLRARWGDKTADELDGYVAEWSKGRMTVQNTSALDLARAALTRAEEASERSDNAAVLTEAARAVLPEGAGFGAGEVALLTAEARALTGRALYLLKRPDEARVALLQGAAALYGAGWATDPAPQPMIPVPEASRERLTELFYWLARVGIDAGDRALVLAALPLAEAHAPDAEWRGRLMLVPMQLAADDGDAAAVGAFTARAAADARARGQEDFARLVEFYRETTLAGMAPTWEEVDFRALVGTARAAVAESRPGGSVDAGFVLGELAGFLVPGGQYGFGLMAARDAIAALAATPEGTGPGATLKAEKMRELAALHLQAALALDSRRSLRLQCPDTPGTGCAIFEGIVELPGD